MHAASPAFTVRSAPVLDGTPCFFIAARAAATLKYNDDPNACWCDNAGISDDKKVTCPRSGSTKVVFIFQGL